MPLPPPLSPDARRDALAKAAEARRQRAELRERLKSGQTTLPELMLRVDEQVIGKMKVASLLESMPGVGPVRARKIMDRLSIPDSRRLRGLGDRQRESLLREFAGR